MIQELLQISILGIIASIFALVIRKNNSELAVLLAICACIAILLFLLKILKPIMDFVEELAGFTGLNDDLIDPVLKSVAVGLLSQLSGCICADAGQNSVAKMIDLVGCVLSLYIALPLFRGILELFRQLGGAK